MPHVPQIRRFRAALAGGVLVLAGLAMPQGPSLAQEESGQIYPTGPSVAQRERGLTRPLDDDTETAPDIAPIIPEDDPTRDPHERDPLDLDPASGQRPVVRDGDLSWPPEPRAPVDGIIENPEPVPVRDGVDPLSIDTRPKEDIDAFESPPAGYDPLLFQIEDLPPIEDRRTRRLARLEPYDPVGIRIGTFVLFPEVELGGSWYSNVLRSSSAESDMALDLRPSARFVSDWKVHALEFRAASTLSFFSDFDGSCLIFYS